MEKVNQEPVAWVADVHMGRYTLEWNGADLPEGTALYAAPKVAQPAMWCSGANLASARITQGRGGPGDQHTCSETKTAYHDTPLYTAPQVAHKPAGITWDNSGRAYRSGRCDMAACEINPCNGSCKTRAPQFDKMTGDKGAAPRVAQPKPLTDEQILRAQLPYVWMHCEGASRELRLRDARRAIAEFCRVNGIGQEGGAA